MSSSKTLKFKLSFSDHGTMKLNNICGTLSQKARLRLASSRRWSGKIQGNLELAWAELEMEK